MLASKIADCFQIDHVAYIPDRFDDRNVSKSKLITSEELSIVSAEYIDIYCANHDLNMEKFVLQKDRYNFHMMNIIDYLTGNSDRHWGNWGFFVDNSNNSLLKLYPLMDFNKAFTSYDTIEGGKCQTVSQFISQKDAAIAAVKEVGLNQKSEINEKWFDNTTYYEMFKNRLEILKTQNAF